MYKCKIYRDIFPCDPSQVETIPAPVSFHFECNLPASPFIGLELRYGGIESTIQRVKLNLEDNIFYCRVDIDYPDIPNDTDGFKDLITWSLDAGWNVASWPKEYVDILGESPNQNN